MKFVASAAESSPSRHFKSLSGVEDVGEDDFNTCTAMDNLKLCT